MAARSGDQVDVPALAFSTVVAAWPVAHTMSERDSAALMVLWSEAADWSVVDHKSK